MHGEEDEKIPIAFNLDNFNALKTTDKEFFIVKKARHENVGDVGGVLYQQKLLDFLNRCVILPPLSKTL